MIGGGGTGGSFGGLASYLTGDEGRVQYVETRNTFEERPDRVAQEMKDAAAASERVEKPVYHLHVSWPKEDETTPEERLEAMEEVLEDLGLDDRQAMIVEHDDAKPHVHAMVNRVQHDFGSEDYGTAWDTGHDWQKIEASLRRIEKDRGWRRVPGKLVETPDLDQEPGEAWTSGQMNYFKRTGDAPLVDQIRAEVGEDFENAESWDELDKALRDKGLKIERKGRGGVVRDAVTGDAVKLSSVGREYSLGKLEDRFDEQYSEYLERREEVAERPDREERPEQQPEAGEREGPARAAERADRDGEGESEGRRGASRGASRGSGRHEGPDGPDRGASENVEPGPVGRGGAAGGHEGTGSPVGGDPGSEGKAAGADRDGSGESKPEKGGSDGRDGGDDGDLSALAAGREPLDDRWAAPFDPDDGDADEPDRDRDDRGREGASESTEAAGSQGFGSSGEADSEGIPLSEWEEPEVDPMTAGAERAVDPDWEENPEDSGRWEDEAEQQTEGRHEASEQEPEQEADEVAAEPTDELSGESSEADRDEEDGRFSDYEGDEGAEEDLDLPFSLDEDEDSEDEGQSETQESQDESEDESRGGQESSSTGQSDDEDRGQDEDESSGQGYSRGYDRGMGF